MGTTSNDWNVSTNWSLGRVPTNANGQPVGDPFDDAVINILTNFPVITADLSATPRYTILGTGAGTNGRVDHRAGIAGAERLIIGREAGTGTYNLANTSVVIGGPLTGFGLGSGSINLSGRLYVGGVDEVTPGATGIFNVNTTGTVAIGNDLTIGSAGGTGVMNVDAGTITTGGWNFIGRGELVGGGNGTLRLGGGTISNNGARTFIGLGDSTGSMVMSGGIYNNIAGGNDTFFAVGVNNLAALTTPTLTMTGGTINSARVFTVGGVEPFGGNGDASFVGAGKGAVVINGAGAQINSLGEFWVGQSGGSNGELTLNAGTLSVSNWIVVARGGSTGKLTVSGGSLVKSGGGHFLVTDASGADGTFVLSGGTVAVNTGELWVGHNFGTGRFEMSGGSMSIGNWVAIGRGGGNGTMNFTGGTFTKTGNGVFIVSDSLNSGNHTTGVLNQSGNSTLTTNEIWVGQGNGGDGTYNISAGSVDSSGWIAVGRERATGVFNISGTGTVIKSGVNNTHIIVGSLGGNGTVNQTGGSVITNPGSGSIFMGENQVVGGVVQSVGQALWDQSAGTVSTDELVVGWVGGVSEYRVRDSGSLSAGHVNIGQGGGTGDAVGIFRQTGGTVTSSTWIAVGIGSSSEAQYNLSGGITNAAGFEVADTRGVVNISGTGVLNVSGAIENPTRNGNGTFNISGGTINTGGYQQGGRDGQVGAGVTNQTGGIVNVTGDLIVQRPNVGTGAYNLSGGTLSVNGSIQGTLGTFTFAGGKITRSSPGVITFNGDLTTGAPAATLGLGPDFSFQINGALNNAAGLTLELTGLGIPDQPALLLSPVTGSFALGAVTVVPAPGAFDIAKTLDVGFDATFQSGSGIFTATRINEDAPFNALTQSVYWIDEDAGVVTLQYSIIPEPGTMTLATLAGLMLAGRRRRRRS
jgi:hypothetical protein